MPAQKDFKRLVRRRMQKTGESYTSARARLLEAPSRKTAVVDARSSRGAATSTPRRPGVRRARPVSPRPDYAKLAGMSDATIEAKTGCDWARWVGALDYVGAEGWPHRKIADYVHEKFDVPGWWAQAVTVGYERIRGLRDVGQRRDGAYEAAKSKTFPVPVETLFDAFTSARFRGRWLTGVKPTVRTATRPKSIRLGWDDGTLVAVWLESKGPGKSSASIQHQKLPDKDAVARTKAFWKERLDALGEVLSG